MAACWGQRSVAQLAASMVGSMVDPRDELTAASMVRPMVETKVVDSGVPLVARMVAVLGGWMVACWGDWMAGWWADAREPKSVDAKDLYLVEMTVACLGMRWVERKVV